LLFERAMLRKLNGWSVLALSVGLSLFAGCGDDDGGEGPSGGQAGSTGSAGRAGGSVGGNGSQAGAGGDGVGGDSGGEDGTAGEDGSAGDDGTAGEGGVGGAGGSAGAPTEGGSAGEGGAGGAGPQWVLSSPAFEDGEAIPDEFTCDGNIFPYGGTNHKSPQLDWTAGPAGTLSYAIVFKDVTLADQGVENGYHWAIWNIPPATLSLPEGLGNTAHPSQLTAATQFSTINDNNYIGPCPNWARAEGAGVDPVPEAVTDQYAFTLYALPAATITVPQDINPDQPPNQVHLIADYLEANALGTTLLTGTSDAQPDTFALPPAN